MDDGFPRLVCPACRMELRGGQDQWLCTGCGAGYRGLLGIPDLRSSDDVFMPNQNDWEYALRLAEDYDRIDFRGLLERYFDLAPELPADLRRRQTAHILGAGERSRHWLDALALPNDRGPMLDLGCGSGSFLVTLGGRPGAVWGLDIALRWLVVARKRLDEVGLTHVRLACGCAERLPFQDRSFAGIVAGDVIEHVQDQTRTLNEGRRVLKPGGRMFLAAPNRFSLAPEPHVGVWGVGFLPRRWMTPYVRWTRKIDFRAIHTLGFGEWKRLLGRSDFRSGEVSAPGLPHSDVEHFGGLRRTLARVYNLGVASGCGQRVARRVGPLFHVVCTRADDQAQAPSANPATPRRSRPSATPG